MKKINANVFTSAVYSSFLGSVVVFVGMIVSFMTDGWALLGDALGGAVLFYFVTAIASCLLAVFVAGPIYFVLTKYGLANYYTSFLWGWRLHLFALDSLFLLRIYTGILLVVLQGCCFTTIL